MKGLVFAVLVTLTAASASAQVVANPSGMLFNNLDYSATIPAGQQNAGQPVITEWQGQLYPVGANVTTATPLVAGGVLPKSAAVGVGASDLRLTFAQMGITLPTCTAAPCPQYKLIIDARGPNGVSLREDANASLPFTAAVPAPLPAPRPAGNQNLRPN